MPYRNLFFDLDDTLWNCSENARDTFYEMYRRYRYERFFDLFEHFYSIYHKRNIELWQAYGKGEIDKDELNRQRFLHPLQAVGHDDPELAKAFSADFFEIIPYKQKLMPHAIELLDYLQPRYNLYILSNGFRKLQSRKMRSGGIDKYFKKIVLSDDIGLLKPRPELFYFALSATQSELRESLMIGDNWDNDIAGARNVGMHQCFYNVTGKADFPFTPTFRITDLRELIGIL